MPKVNLKRGKYQKIDTSVADVLITSAQPLLLFMGGNTVPTKDSVFLPVTPPIFIPKGVGAYITAGSVEAEAQGAAYDLATSAPTNVFPS